MTTQALFDLAERHGHLILPPPSGGTIDSISIVLPSGTYAVILGPAEDKKEYRDHASHEMGHCEESAFYTKLSAPANRGRCEEAANRWQYEHMMPLQDIKRAFQTGVTATWELSDLFEMPESFVKNAVEYYKMKYGADCLDK